MTGNMFYQTPSLDILYKSVATYVTKCCGGYRQNYASCKTLECTGVSIREYTKMFLFTWPDCNAKTGPPIFSSPRPKYSEIFRSPGYNFDEIFGPPELNFLI